MQITEDRVPSLFSWAFHLRFFPALLMGRFRPAANPGRGFAPSTSLESAYILVIIGSVITAGASLLSRLPLIGLMLLVLGIAGFVYVFYLSLIGAKGIRPSYNNFLFGLFFFLLMLGVNMGLIAAIHNPWWIKILFGILGAAAGYWIGLLTGIHAQRLGFVATLLDQLSVFGALGLSIPAILLAVAA